MCISMFRQNVLHCSRLQLVVVLLVAVQSSLAMTVERATNTGNGESSLEAWISLLLAALVLMCGLVMLLGCVQLCERFGNVFTKFDNPSVSEFSLGHIETPPAAAPTTPHFAMYPPADSTHDTSLRPATPIFFEPLPVVMTRQMSAASDDADTKSRLYPKVSRVSSHEVRRGYGDADLNPATTSASHELQELIAHSVGLIRRGQLQYIKAIGCGWFGKVLRGEGDRLFPGHKKTKVVVRMLRESASVDEQLTFLQEAAPYQLVDHPNVLQVLGLCVDVAPLLVVSEFCPFGDLKSYLQGHRVALRSFDEKGLLLKFACDMAAGLNALHQLDFVHRDFAIRNCLLTSELSVKVGDYGLGEEMFKKDYYVDLAGNAIAIRWMAPEMIRYHGDNEDISLQHITKSANIWTFGIALWEIVQFGALPYCDLSDRHVLRLVVSERSIKLSRPDVSVSSIDRLYELMCLCWADRPSDRPSLRQLRIMLLHLMSHRLDATAAASAAFERKWNQLLPRRPPEDAIRPSLLESSFSASLLCQAGSLQSDGGGEEARGDGVGSPVNELSLEAEMGALRQRGGGATPGAQSTAAVQSGRGSRGGAESGRSLAGGACGEVRPEPAGDGGLADLSLTPSGHMSSADEDEDSEALFSDDVFAASTPKAGGCETGSSPGAIAYQTAMCEQDSSWQLYETAVSSHSLTRSLSDDDRSFLQPAKFAALLQTVPMSLDYDDDDDDDDVELTSPAQSLAEVDDGIFSENDTNSQNTLSPSEVTLQGVGGSRNNSAVTEGGNCKSPVADKHAGMHEEGGNCNSVSVPYEGVVHSTNGGAEGRDCNGRRVAEGGESNNQ